MTSEIVWRCLETKDLSEFAATKKDPNCWFTPEDITDTFILGEHFRIPKVPQCIRDQFTPEEISELEKTAEVSSLDLVLLDAMGWEWKSIIDNEILMEKIKKHKANFSKVKISFLQSIGVL